MQLKVLGAVVMKIYNDEIWEDVKLGKYKGLSIEGYYIDKIEKTKSRIKITRRN
jgi:hypothetical protein